MTAPSEFAIQRAFTLWLRGDPDPRTGIPRRTPALRPGVVAWHTPNGGARSAIEGKRFREIGTLPGIPDYLFLWGGLYGLEFKAPGGKLSTAQLDVRERLLAAGAGGWSCVDNLADARRVVVGWNLVDSNHLGG